MEPGHHTTQCGNATTLRGPAGADSHGELGQVAQSRAVYRKALDTAVWRAPSTWRENLSLGCWASGQVKAPPCRRSHTSTDSSRFLPPAFGGSRGLTLPSPGDPPLPPLTCPLWSMGTNLSCHPRKEEELATEVHPGILL